MSFLHSIRRQLYQNSCSSTLPLCTYLYKLGTKDDFRYIIQKTTSRFGDKPLKFQASCPQDGTEVLLKGFGHISWGEGRQIYLFLIYFSLLISILFSVFSFCLFLWTSLFHRMRISCLSYPVCWHDTAINVFFYFLKCLPHLLSGGRRTYFSFNFSFSLPMWFFVSCFPFSV